MKIDYTDYLRFPSNRPVRAIKQDAKRLKKSKEGGTKASILNRLSRDNGLDMNWNQAIRLLRERDFAVRSKLPKQLTLLFGLDYPGSGFECDLHLYFKKVIECETDPNALNLIMDSYGYKIMRPGVQLIHSAGGYELLDWFKPDENEQFPAYDDLKRHRSRLKDSSRPLHLFSFYRFATDKSKIGSALSFIEMLNQVASQNPTRKINLCVRLLEDTFYHGSILEKALYDLIARNNVQLVLATDFIVFKKYFKNDVSRFVGQFPMLKVDSGILPAKYFRTLDDEEKYVKRVLGIDGNEGLLGRLKRKLESHLKLNQVAAPVFELLHHGQGFLDDKVLNDQFKSFRQQYIDLPEGPAPIEFEIFKPLE